MKKARARPRRIPAFGEWNYYDGGGGDWPVTQYFDSAMEAAGVVVMASLPPSPTKPAVKKAVKWLSDSPNKPEVAVGLGLGLGEHEHEQEQEHGAEKKKQGKQSCRVAADIRAHMAATRKAVKAVDEDLYDIPPDMLCHVPTEKGKAARRSRKRGRSVWRGCLGGLGCIVV